MIVNKICQGHGKHDTMCASKVKQRPCLFEVLNYEMSTISGFCGLCIIEGVLHFVLDCNVLHFSFAACLLSHTSNYEDLHILDFF